MSDGTLEAAQALTKAARESAFESRARSLIRMEMNVRKLPLSDIQGWMEEVVKMTGGGSMFFSISLTRVLPILQKMREEESAK